MQPLNINLRQLTNRGIDALERFSRNGLDQLMQAMGHLATGLPMDLAAMDLKVATVSRSNRVSLTNSLDTYYAQSARGVRIDDPNLR